MALLTPVPGKSDIDLVRRLAAAVGVTQPFSRLVIEIAVTKPITVYVKAPLDIRAIKSITEAFEWFQVESVTVDDDTTVHVVKIADKP